MARRIPTGSTRTACIAFLPDGKYNGLAESNCRSRNFLTVLPRLVSSAGGGIPDMRSVRLITAACVLFIAQPLFAQEWTEYRSLEDRFGVSAPATPPTIEK